MLDRQRKGGEEKEWLVNIAMKDLKDGGAKDVTDEMEMKKEGGVKVAGVKRRKEEDE